MCDCDTPDLYREKTVKARKQHQCTGCLQTISKGAQYLYICGMWDGDFQDFKLHLRCARIIRRLEKDSDCCIPFEAMLEELHNHTYYRKQQRLKGIKLYPPSPIRPTRTVAFDYAPNSPVVER